MPAKDKTNPKPITAKKAVAKKTAGNPPRPKIIAPQPRAIISGTAPGGTPPVQSVYIQISESFGVFEFSLFFDIGITRMTDSTPLYLLGDGKIQFNFIKSPRTTAPITADLIIIAQTVRDTTQPRGHRRDTPFKHPRVQPKEYYPVYYLPSPAGPSDPHNEKCECKTAFGDIVIGRDLDVIKAPGGRQTGPYKCSIVALCDGATKVASVDPTVIINPN